MAHATFGLDGVVGGNRHGDMYKGGPTTFLISTMPEIFTNTHIVAAASPDIEAGNPDEGGWFLADFYAFNYLLKGAGASQVWLTAADLKEYLETYSNFQFLLHGNPFQDRRVVLSEDLLNKGEYTPVTVVRNTNMVEAFLDSVRTASVRARDAGAPLLLFIFCHGLQNCIFLLNHEDQASGVSVSDLKAAIAPGCQVTLVSTACYSGGWVVTENLAREGSSLNATMLGAAGVSSTSNSWPASNSVGRYCGSVFASTLIKALTEEVPAVEAATAASTASPSQPRSAQPNNPNEAQIRTYNAFCRTVLNVCSVSVTRMWFEQQLTFSAQDDKWASSWPGRSGIPLARFEQRWKALPAVPYTGPAQKKLDLDQSPSNPSFQGNAEYCKTGGALPSDSMTSSLVKNRVADMARLMLQMCPNDWTRDRGPGLASLLRKAARGETATHRTIDVADTLRFRWELGLLADEIVERFRLPVPRGESCLQWDDFAWKKEVGSRIKDSIERYDAVFGALSKRGFMPVPCPNQGPNFYRFIWYVGAAIVEADLAREATMGVCNEVCNYMENVKNFHRQRLEDEPMAAKSQQQWGNTLEKGFKTLRLVLKGEKLQATGGPLPKTNMRRGPIPDFLPSNPKGR